MPYITSGQLKSLAVSTAKRSSALPNVPTVAETGIGDFDSHYGSASLYRGQPHAQFGSKL
jgi:tripartite-type tricarboxylate transporter receptor subunit TctC